MALEKLLKDMKRNAQQTQAETRTGVPLPRKVLSPLVDEYYLKLPADDHGGKGIISPSSLGGCKRALYYSYIGAKREGGFESTSKSIFEDGTYRHARWEDVFKRMHHDDIGGFQILAIEEFKRDKKTHIGGSLDLLVRVDSGDYIVDVKGMRGRYFWPLLKSNDIGEQYLLQIHAYMDLWDVGRYIFWVECKDTNDTHEIVGEKDPAIMKKVLTIAEDIRCARLEQTPPPRDCTKSSYSCKTCVYQTRCWKGA